MSYIGRKLNYALIKKQNSKREIDYSNNDIAHNYVFELSAGILIRQSQTIICTHPRDIRKKDREKLKERDMEAQRY